MSDSSVCVGVTAEAIAMAAAGKPVEAVEATGSARLARLFDAHNARLYRLARRMSPSGDQARDLVQETFLRAARKLESIPEGAEEAWLVRVLVNICRDGWRRRARYARIAPRLPNPGAESSPEDAVVARTDVWRALQRLPPRRRAAIVMYELEGATIPEIAMLLGVTPVTVRWHLSRGRRELAAAIRRPTGVGPTCRPDL